MHKTLSVPSKCKVYFLVAFRKKRYLLLAQNPSFAVCKPHPDFSSYVIAVLVTGCILNKKESQTCHCAKKKNSQLGKKSADRLTFLAVPPIIPEGAVTVIAVPLWPAGPPVGTGTFHTWVS